MRCYEAKLDAVDGDPRAFVKSQNHVLFVVGIKVPPAPILGTKRTTVRVVDSLISEDTAAGCRLAERHACHSADHGPVRLPLSSVACLVSHLWPAEGS